MYHLHHQCIISYQNCFSALISITGIKTNAYEMVRIKCRIHARENVQSNLFISNLIGPRKIFEISKDFRYEGFNIYKKTKIRTSNIHQHIHVIKIFIFKIQRLTVDAYITSSTLKK